MFANPRVRAVLGAGTALAVVAGIGIGLATSSSAASNRYVTALAATGDVTQTYSATGTITRKNTSAVSFAVDGTVKTVDVAVGDTVDAGDTLAVLDKGELQLAVLNATTTVAQAEASLYSAQHPASASSSSKSSKSSSSSSSNRSSAAAVVINPVVLNEAVSRINLAILDEADKCNAIFNSILPSPSPTATASPTATSAAGDAAAQASTSATPTATATPTPTASDTAAKDDASATQDKNPVATASASQLAKTLSEGDFTDDQLQACANARAEVILANANLQQVVAHLTGQGGSGGGSVKKPSSSGSSSSSTTTVSKSAVAKAKASLLQAQQGLASAQQDLANATLVAPISGTVGLVGLSKGASASSGSITIVGSGSAVVTFELPLTTRELVKVGQSVTVTPAGSAKTLSGKITAIASLETTFATTKAARVITAVTTRRRRISAAVNQPFARRGHIANEQGAVM